MQDEEDVTLTEAPEAAPKDHAPGLLMLLVGIFVLGASAVTLSVMTALYKVNPWVSSSVGLLFAVGFPLFMALRARSALVRRGLKKILRRTTLLLLVSLLQLTMVLVVVFWVGRSGADHAKMLGRLVAQGLGEVPVLTRTLARIGEDSTLTFDDDPTEVAGSDAGPARTDGGVVVARDGGTPVAAKGIDAGPAAADAGPPDAAKNVVLHSAVLVEGDGGGRFVVFVDVADDGTVAFVARDIKAEAGHAVVPQVYARPDGAWLRVGTDGALWVPRDGKNEWHLQTKDAVEAGKVRAVQDIAPAGDGVLLVADVVDDVGERVSQALILSTKKGPVVLRAQGDDIPGDEGGEARRYRILDTDEKGRFVVEEEYVKGGKSVAVKLTGDTFKMNPRRVLTGDAVAPKALTELWRTGRADPADDKRHLQAPVMAEVVGDGSVLFVANTVEHGKKGGWYRAKNADDVRPFGLRTGDKAWGASLTARAHAIARLQLLAADPWGRVVHVDIDAQKHTSNVWLRVGQRTPQGKIQRLDRVELSADGKWGLAVAEVGKSVALVVFDQEGAKAVVLRQGEALPGGPAKAQVAKVEAPAKSPGVLGSVVGLR